MNADCLQYRLTDSERQTFDETGYLIIEDALSPEQVENLTAKVDAIYADGIAKGHNPDAVFIRLNFVPDDPAFAELVDYEKTFPKIWGILGWNIYLYHAPFIVTPPSGQQPDNKTFGWHQDSGRVNFDMETHPRPRLSLKTAFFLSDTSEPGRANFWVLPGSHVHDKIELPPDGIGQPEGAVPVLAKPGTAVTFDRRLWHSATTNWSNITRKVLFYGYAYRWIQPNDENTTHTLWDVSSPIRRQLFGEKPNSQGPYYPKDEDVPLRTWLREHSPDEAK